MGSINILAGDFRKGPHHKYDNCFLMKIDNGFYRQKISDSYIEQLEIASEENITSIGGSIGWGIAGSALLGPVGLLTGVIFGGKKGKSITFICKFKDGRKFIGVTSSKTFSWINQRFLVSSFEKKEGSKNAISSQENNALRIIKTLIYTIIAVFLLAWLFGK
jgi:hypothetical protein